MQEIPSKKAIGERIKNLRIENDLSQAFIAKILDISRSNYSQIELGNQFPTFNTLNHIARYYSKSYDWILHGEDYTFVRNNDKDISHLINDLELTLSGFKLSLQKLEDELTLIKNQRFKEKTFGISHEGELEE